MSLRTPYKARFISPLTVRILVIMLFPVAAFLVGLFLVDQYRATLIKAELTALERQGTTLALSLGLEDARSRPFTRGPLSASSIRHLEPFVSYGPRLRVRLFQSDGQLAADTFRLAGGRSHIRIRRREEHNLIQHLQRRLVFGMNALAQSLSNSPEIPTRNLRGVRHAVQLPDVQNALEGYVTHNVWRRPDGRLVLSVALPVQNLRVVRGALLMTTTDGDIEANVEAVQWAFVQLFALVLLLTIALGVYLSRSIIKPVLYLAASADRLRQTKDPSETLRRLPERKDEIGQLSTALGDMTAELQKRIKATASFAADVAHELKNPLTSLRSAVETISRIDNPEQQRKLMDIIVSDVGRLDRLISDISSISRVDAELSGNLPQAEDITEVLMNWVSALSDRYQGQKFELDCDKTPRLVAMHTGRIVQILDNLMGNAISFHPKDGPEPVSVGLNTHKGQVVITIRDRGPGIPTDKSERIFERFYTERPQENFGTHSGLGLSISRQIARAHGGDLHGANHPEGGAVFTLTLPLAS